MKPWTLAQARDWVERMRGEGINCPCCGQFAKSYRRKLNSTMARLLISLVREFDKDPRWYSVREPWHLNICQGGDLGKLAHWELVTEKPKNLEDTEQQPGGKTSGFWMPTERGVWFAFRKSQELSHVLLYDGKVQGFDGEAVHIDECLSQDFDYRELMGEEGA